MHQHQSVPSESQSITELGKELLDHLDTSHQHMQLAEGQAMWLCGYDKLKESSWYRISEYVQANLILPPQA